MKVKTNVLGCESRKSDLLVDVNLLMELIAFKDMLALHRKLVGKNAARHH